MDPIVLPVRMSTAAWPFFSPWSWRRIGQSPFRIRPGYTKTALTRLFFFFSDTAGGCRETGFSGQRRCLFPVLRWSHAGFDRCSAESQAIVILQQGRRLPRGSLPLDDSGTFFPPYSRKGMSPPSWRVDRTFFRPCKLSFFFPPAIKETESLFFPLCKKRPFRSRSSP